MYSLKKKIQIYFLININNKKTKQFITKFQIKLLSSILLPEWRIFYEQIYIKNNFLEIF